MVIFHRLIYDFSFSTILFEIPGDFSAEVDKLILKFIRETREPEQPNRSGKWDNKLGKLKCPSLKTYYKTVVSKTLWYQHKGRHINKLAKLINKQNNINKHLCQLIFDKGVKEIQQGKE